MKDILLKIVKFSNIPSYFFLAIVGICLLVKAFLFWGALNSHNNVNSEYKKISYYLVLILAMSSFIDVSIMLCHVRSLGHISQSFMTAYMRIDAIAWILQFCSWPLLFRELSSNKFSKKAIFPIVTLGVLFSLGYLVRAIQMYTSGHPSRIPLDILMHKSASYYIMACIIFSLVILYRNYKKESIMVLKSHNYIFGRYLVLPFFINRIAWIIVAFFSYDVAFSYKSAFLTSLFTTILLAYSFYKLMAVRFLNINKRVTASSSERVLLLSEFRETIEKFHKAKGGRDLVRITKEFFGKAFSVPGSKVHLMLKGRLKFSKEESRGVQITRAVLSRLLDPEDGNHGVRRLIEQKKVLITDEVEFSNFSEPELAKSEPFKEILGFLQHANVDVVIPLFCSGNFSGAIVVDRHCRSKKFFNSSEQDQILLFSEHLAHVMYELIYENPEVLLEEKQYLEAELYEQQQINKNFRNSIETFLKQGPTEKLGVLVYKNKKFTYCNKDAHDLLTVDLNKDKGLDFTKEIYAKALHTAQFFVEHKIVLEDPSGNLLAFKFAPNVKRDNTVVTVTKPNISDVIKEDCNLLDQPSQWNTLLALRSTEEGKVVDDFLPAQSKGFLNFKISLLEKAMTRKFLVFDLADEDVESFAHVVHNISKRNRMEEVDARESGLTEKLFGVNGTSKGLLNALDKTGTLVVRNFHVLDKELQKKFYKLITSGTYNPMQGEEQLKADVLIIFSSNQNLHNLETEKLISKELASALALGEVSLPAFSGMDEEEVISLSEGLRNKLVVNKLYANLLILTDVDKKKILASNCASLYELKAKVKHLVFLKTKKEGIKASKATDPAYEVADFELMDIARLGKDALKDPRAIEKLVSKFNGNQSHIAEFLGVHRSSVCRRVEQYQKENPEEKKVI